MRKLSKSAWACICLVLLVTTVSVANANTYNRNLETTKQEAASTERLLESAKGKAIERAHKAEQAAEQAKTDAEAAKQREAAERAEKERLQAELQARVEAKAKLAAEQQRSRQVATATQRITQPAGATLAGCSNLQPLVAQYDWNVPTMMRIMELESGCNPANHNFGDNHRSCMGSYGLFQIGCVHNVSVAAMADPAQNIAKAYQIWRSQGYAAWTTYGK